MKKYFFWLIFSFFFLFAFGNFVLAKEKVFTSLTFYHYEVYQSWDKSGQLSNNIGLDHYNNQGFGVYTQHPFIKDQIAAYVRYLHSLEWEFSLLFPYNFQRSGINFNSGLSDLEISAFYNLYNLFLLDSLTLQGTLGFPGGYNINNSPYLGYGPGSIYLGFTWPFGAYPLNLEAYGGYKDYLGYAADQIKWGLRGLLALWGPFFLVGSIDTTKGMNNEDRADPAYAITQAQSYNIVTLDLAFRIAFNQSFSWLIGYYEDVWGRNTGHGRGLKTSFWYAFY